MKNPFSKGNPCVNCFSTLCGPLPPGLLDLRAIVTPDDNIHMSPTRMMNTTNTNNTLRYQVDENGHFTNYVIYLLFLKKTILFSF
jgi:hypothetical protein